MKKIKRKIKFRSKTNSSEGSGEHRRRSLENLRGSLAGINYPASGRDRSEADRSDADRSAYDRSSGDRPEKERSGETDSPPRFGEEARENYRINRYLARAGYGSRRGTERLILEGRVQINGAVSRELDARVGPGDLVLLDGRLVSLPGVSRYYAMNKPAGYVVSAREFPGSSTIYSLLPEDMRGLKYAGRLDRESRGLILLSDDGNFIQAATHPSRRLLKVYHVTLDQLPEETERDMQRSFYRGIEDRGEALRAVRLNVLSREERRVEVVLGQGKNRQIRRMFAAVGARVTDLQRVALGHLDLRKTPIPEGKFISVQPEEIFYGPNTRKSEFDPWSSAPER